MPKPTKHPSEALGHLDRAMVEVILGPENTDFDELHTAIEDAQREIKECRDETADLLDDLRAVTE